MKLTTSLIAAILPALAWAKADPANDEDLAIQAAKHVIYSYEGLTPPAHLLDLTRQGKVGGIITFGENVDENLGNVIQEFQTAYAESPAYFGSPLLIMTDQEGGKVRRLPGGPGDPAKVTGQAPDPKAAGAEAGETAASVLKSYLNNCNLAPVLDVYRTADNFLDKVGRSYGNTSELVSACATAFIVAQEGAGVIATAKHFPGLGAAGDENTDLQPVTIDIPLDELRSTDEVPYEKAIAAKVDMVMMSWAIYPALDAERPAGLSKAWVQDELRERLGFKGVTVTDALEAVSLERFGDDAQRGLLAGQAGVDLLLASGRNATQGEAVLNALVQGLKDGSLSKREFDAGTKRIDKLRKKLEF
ncbi:hypothetical protein AJ79_04990 [Helicocarpus griseus UAMH5409]|uniref:Glycoside hydrolase family 3 N-terminal domain-containing protein n=1 Tax=Helicocarpus griseus UAMH5409 TaxID=1447875 RepID=A0A2B7XQN2_9EURO|nr:hypothetical protein AJ79_04990 [Helicocarpus griseus UAMH5409]